MDKLRKAWPAYFLGAGNAAKFEAIGVDDEFAKRSRSNLAHHFCRVVLRCRHLLQPDRADKVAASGDQFLWAYGRVFLHLSQNQVESGIGSLSGPSTDRTSRSAVDKAARRYRGEG